MKRLGFESTLLWRLRPVASIFLAVALALLALGGGSARAAFPGTNGKIAFVSERDGAGAEIYLMDSDGSNQTRLTTGGYFNAEPAWSPDGTKIAFSRVLGPSTTDIFVINADGSAETALTNDPATDSNPSWSPDGSKIAFVSTRGGDTAIYVMNADGSGQTRLAGPGGNPGFGGPVWSPDGQKSPSNATASAGWATTAASASST